MANTADLFPILDQPRVNGLGRMAMESEHLDAGHDVEFRSLAAKSILNKSVSKRLGWMAWSINPYRGCEFGCRYCYARYTHEFLAPAEPVRGVLADADSIPSLSSRSAAEGSASVPAVARIAGVAQQADPSAALRDDKGKALRDHNGNAPWDDGGKAPWDDNERESGALDLRDPDAFERRIFIKQNAAWLLEQDLRRLARQGRLEEEIAIGTATDPWQPIERRAKVTRSLLEVLARYEGLRIGIVTKSSLIQRDIDLLQQIAERSTLVVHITITTPDVELARRLEPRAPRPDLRFETVWKLRQAGIRTGILNSPLLPGITDSAESIDRMAALAKRYDASFFAAMPLFLKSCSRPTYFDFVRDNFPQLQVLYAERFRDMDFASRPYRLRLEALVKASCVRHGLRERLTDNLLTRDAGDDRSFTRLGEKKPASSAQSGAQGMLFG